MRHVCRGKGCLWNHWSQELSDEIIAVWEMEASEGWGLDRKTRLVFLPHYDPSPGPEEEEMMLTEQLNWNSTLLRTAGQSEAWLGSGDQWEVSVVGMAIKLKYDNDTKLGFWRWSEIKQSPHTKHYYQGCLNLYLPRYITVSYNLNLWELVLDLVLNLSFAYLMFWVIFLDLIAMLTSLLSFIKRWRNLTRVGW